MRPARKIEHTEDMYELQKHTMSLSSALRRVKIQYASDLHLEFYDKIAFPHLVRPAARYLVLAGDIGHPNAVFKSFITYVSSHWEHVFYVTGNHEYYAREQKHWKYAAPATIQERDEELESIVSKHGNVHMLSAKHPSYYLAEMNLAFVGATLWSHVPPCMEERAATGMNDYRLIPCRGADGAIRPLTPMDTNMLHARDKQVLDAQIRFWGSQKTDVCVVTHHMPSFGLVSPRYVSNPLNACFASDCEGLMQSHVKGWIYGHTHNAASGFIGSTFTGCNAAGYPNERVEGWSAERCMELQIRGESDEEGMNPELVAAAIGMTSPIGHVRSRGSSSSSEDIEFH
jgi:hypothetical protein